MYFKQTTSLYLLLGGTRRVVLLLPDGSLTMTELDKEQYESITEAGKAQE
jgi:hypothetical protein